MTRPDLSDPAARGAYRQELRALARGPRFAGYLSIFAAIGLWAWPQSGGPERLGPLSTESWGWLLLGFGWAMLIWTIFVRTRYNRARMRGDDPAL